MTVKLSSLGPREWDQGGPAQGGRLAQLLPLAILLLKAVAGDVAFLTGSAQICCQEVLRQPHLSQPVESGETVRYGRNSGSKAGRKLNAGSLLCTGCQEMEEGRSLGCRRGWAVNVPGGWGVSQLLRLAEQISEAIVESELKHIQHRRNHCHSVRHLLLASIHEGTGQLQRHALFQPAQEAPFKRRAERQLC